MGVTGILGRNPGLTGWAALHPRVAYQEHKLMRLHRQREKQCAVCGATNDLFVHHTTPLWKDVSQAATGVIRVDGEERVCRFMTMCGHCHLVYGHDRDYGHKYVENVSMVAACIRQAKRSEVIVRRDDNVVEKTH